MTQKTPSSDITSMSWEFQKKHKLKKKKLEESLFEEVMLKNSHKGTDEHTNP